MSKKTVPTPTPTPTPSGPGHLLCEAVQDDLAKCWKDYEDALDAKAYAEAEMTAAHYRACKAVGLSPRRFAPVRDDATGAWRLIDITQARGPEGA